MPYISLILVLCICKKYFQRRMGEVGDPSDSSRKSQDSKESPLGKDKNELPNSSSNSGSCPFHNWFYIGVALFALSYAVYLQDRYKPEHFALFMSCLCSGKVGGQLLRAMALVV